MDLPTAENCTLLWNKTLNINEINDQLNIGSCGLQVKPLWHQHIVYQLMTITFTVIINSYYSSKFMHYIFLLKKRWQAFVNLLSVRLHGLIISVSWSVWRTKDRLRKPADTIRDEMYRCTMLMVRETFEPGTFSSTQARMQPSNQNWAMSLSISFFSVIIWAHIWKYSQGNLRWNEKRLY